MTRAPIAAIIVLMALASLSFSPPPARADVNVDVDDFFFYPRDVVIAPGETVTWTVANGFHTSTSGLDSNDPAAGVIWDSDFLLPGSVYARTFSDAGVYPYFCRFHDALDMKGTVTVSRVRAARLKGAEGAAAEPTSWGMIKGIYR